MWVIKFLCEWFLLSVVSALCFCALIGCAGPTVYHYSWGDIIKADPNYVWRRCHEPGSVWDDGMRVMRGERYAGCLDGKTILIEDSCAGAKAIPHELAHLDGIKNPGSKGYDW